jgi:hypothetical protein
MDETGQNPLTRLDRNKTNYPLIIAAFAMAVVLAFGLIVSLKSWNTTAAFLFFIAGAIFAAVVLVDIAARRRIAATDDRKFIDWNSEMPEVQRENASIEVRELARLLKVEDDQLPELYMAFVVACDLALRQIQQEENLPLMRHVSIGKAPFDAILVDQDLITCIEVAFLVEPNVRNEKVESMLKKIARAKKNLVEMKSGLRLRLMLVLVTQLNEQEEEDLRATLGTKRFSDTPVDIDIRMLDFETLQQLYLSE